MKPPKGAKKQSNRVGRGPGSGNGKTAGKGHKGQKSRSGGSKGPGFEGGQMPLIRRIPKRGFNNTMFQKRWVIVNLLDLERCGEERIDDKVMTDKGLIKGAYHGIKVLGDGELSRAIHVRAHAISAGARRKLEAAGGTFEVIGS